MYQIISVYEILSLYSSWFSCFQPTVKQSCKQCKIMVYPDKTEKLRRPEEMEEEEGTGRKRHINPRRAHREDLCSRCRTGIPCYIEQ